jgi:hypothetical protein
MTRRIRISGFVLVALLPALVAAGCGGSKGSAATPVSPSATPSAGPAPAPTPAPTPAVRVSFTTVNVLTGRPVTGVRVQIEGRADLDSGPTGTFVVEGATASVLAVTLSSSEIVTRVTHLRVPGSDGEIALIPKDFNMSAFEQMARRPGSGLVRWTTPPRLLIQRRVLRWAETAGDTYTSTTDQLMSDAAAKAITDDLVMALPDLTGGEYRNFADIVHTTAGVNNPVSMVSAGDIVVAYFTGLTAARGAIGLGSRTYGNDGSVRSGQVYLDAGYDGQGLYAHIARMHELGHALGWDHVTDAASVMAPVATNWPTSFDRDATRVAFKRGLGNRAPDNDQDAFTINPLGLAGPSIKMP